MEIGSKNVDVSSFRHRNLNELSPQEYAMALDAMKKGEYWNPAWTNQQHTDQGLTFPRIASKYGNTAFCDNDARPDPRPPAELFNFDLILNGRKFKVMCDALLRINSEEDLAEFSEKQLSEMLEKCASYRMTCFCAYVAAHRECRRWQMWHDEWMAGHREEARQQLRAERLADKAAGLRKEIGQLTAQELDDWVIRKYSNDYRKNLELVNDWEENEKVFLELRDTLKDRGMHLQTLLRRVTDHTDHMKSSGDQA